MTEEVPPDATTLDKAKAAAKAAGEIDPNEMAHGDLLRIAEVQANIAQAEALTRIADVVERIMGGNNTPSDLAYDFAAGAYDAITQRRQ